MTSALLEVRHLRVEFPTRHGTLTALDDISFDIAPGEILGVVGESGAGKSLTGAAIIGLLDPPGRVAGGEEPTTALDVSIQAQIISLLKRLCKDHGAAVMLVTHDMGVIAETSDRVAVMYAGRIAEIGPVHDVIRAPAHPYTVGLMGSIPAMDEREYLLQIDGAMPRLNAIPRGCAFNPRCPRVFDRCRIERPDLLDAGASRAACWLHDHSMKAVA